MEYLEGESIGGLLRRLWTKGTSLDPFLAAYIMAEACRGLHAAHELADEHGTPPGLVHRDISPQNLFVKQLDRRSDIFSMGIVLYELLTARRLFARETELLTLQAVCDAPVVPPSRIAGGTPPELDTVCMTALARPRTERYATCADMGRQLLEAMRAMARSDSEHPEHALARRMHELYADRIEEKRVLLQRARLGADITSPPTAEADCDVEVPRVDEGTQFASMAFLPVQRPRKSRWRSTTLAMLIGGALVTVGALGGWVWWHPRAMLASLPLPEIATEEASAPTSQPNEVTLHVTAAPAGSVYVDGRSFGETPVLVPLRRSSSVKLTVSRPGYQTYEQTILADEDQRLVITLTPVRAPIPRRKRVEPRATPVAPAPAASPARPEML